MSYAAAGVGVGVGGGWLLEAASLEIASGEIVALAGPNGAGKTTLIRALAGDVRPATGGVSLDGLPLERWSRGQLARRRAVMSPHGAVAFGFTAAEVVLLGRLPLHGGDPTDVDRAIVGDLLRAVDCTHLADRVFATLSTGERQRVQLARAIAQVSDAGDAGDPTPGRAAEGDARYLLLDEPTSSLDPAHQHTAMQLLRREAALGRGVLVVLHDLNLAAAYADRVALMKDGRIVEVGDPVAVLRPDLLEAVFDIPMRVLQHPDLSHPLVIPRPPPRAESTGRGKMDGAERE